MEANNEVNNVLIPDGLITEIRDRIYNERINFLKKCYNKVFSNKRFLLECQKSPFIRQVLQLNILLSPLTDKEKNNAIDAVLESPVYDRVRQEELKNPQTFDHIDQLVKELLKWFKEDFFKWVNKLDCNKCGNSNQDKIQGITPVKPYKSEHYSGKASIVERYQCLDCKSINEFPRYNDICTLLKTRKGRCGEWNNCFIAILRSLDVDVRYIWNAEDHVWCEYYSDKQRRWIHLDSCENSYDEPMLYNVGWGKKMSYVFAIGPSYIIDVSTKYIDQTKPELQLPRNKAGQSHIQSMLIYTNSVKIMKLNKSEALKVTSQLIADVKSTSLVHGNTNAVHSEQDTNRGDNMKPRQSGGANWTKARGEAGQ